MAATIVGITTMTFGGSAETVAVFTTFAQTSDAQKQTVTDEDGDFIAAAYYSKKSSATMSGFLKGTIPSIGASITLANSITGMSGVTGTFYVDSVSVAKAPNSFNTVTVQATNHAF